MPLAGASGISNSSSRCHSSIYGSAMAAKPAAPTAASRPPNAAFRVGSNVKAFSAPISSRNAAEDRIGRYGRGGVTFAPPSPEPAAVGRSEPAGMAAAGRALRSRHGGGESVSALLHDSSAASPPPSPSVWSNGRGPTPQQSARSHHSAWSLQHQSQSQQAMGMAAPQQDLLSQRAAALTASSAGFTSVCADDLTVTELSEADPAPAAPHLQLGWQQSQQSQQSQQQQQQQQAFAAPTPPPPPAAPPFHALPIAPPAPAPPPAPPPPLPPQAVPLQPTQPKYAPIDPAKAHVGKGVFANVRMTHGRDGQVIAVKTYDHKEAKQERSVAKHMLNEERLAGRIQHENIIAPQVARRGDGVTQLEMEYAPGGTLEAHVKKLKRNLTEDEAKTYFRQVVDAVVYLHEEGIAHRDIKMENIVLDAHGICRLVDFGAAREGGTDTFLMSMQGTPAYMAPEVAQQRAHKGGPADIWALGVVLYNLVSGGSFPFWGRSMEELRRNISAQQLRLPANLSPACRELITSLLTKSSATRLSAADVRQHRWLSSGPPPAAEPPPPAAEPPIETLAHGDAPGARPDPRQAAVAADAAATAEAYRTGTTLDAARAAATNRLLQAQENAHPTAAAKARAAAAAGAAPSPRGAVPSPRGATPAYAPNYHHANYGCSRPSTAGSRPGTASSGVYTVGSSSPAASPRTTSRLAGLMTGNGRPGTATGPAAGQRPGSAQMGRVGSAAAVGYGYRR